MTRRTLIGVVLIATTAASLWAIRSRFRAEPLPPGAHRGLNILIVTIDTLRADRVGAYGSLLGATPTLDRLAREGVRFAETYAHVPLTLPSHATIMTGLYPFANDVRDNGTFRLDAATPTLATAVRSTGYRTGAFIGAFVLDARFGLHSGFDVYDDRLVGSGSDLEVVQRSAEQVLAPAAEWIIQSSAATTEHPAPGTRHPAAGTQPSALSTKHPWLAWVHLYDPHEPYDPPEPYRSRYTSDAYMGEVAYTDAALGAFLERLRTAGALERTLVIVTSDHGESLGEHGERTHGLFAYNATLRVPLIVWTRGAHPTVVKGAARLVDITPTILDLVGVPVPTRLDGRSLRRAIAGERVADSPPSYFEALNANLTRDWAPLKGVVSGGLKFIDLPLPELYDLAADPGETRNIYAAERGRARPLESQLDRLASGQRPVATTAVDPDAAARLRSLGYVVGSSAPSRRYTVADDPKRLAPLNTALDDAAAVWSRGDVGQATAILQRVIEERPDLTIAYDRLAFILRATGRVGEAVRLLDGAARAGHGDPALLRSLGAMLRDAGDLQRSESVLEALVRQHESDLQAVDALGQTYTQMRRFDDAEAMFRRVLAASPNAASTWNNLGVMYLRQNRAADAIAALGTAVGINPFLAGAHNALGVAYARTGNLQRAADEWNQALRIRPDFEDARANLAKIGAR